MKLRVFFQQFGYLAVVSAFRVTFQSASVVFLQLVIQAAAHVKLVVLVGAVFLCQLPPEKEAEDGPEVKCIQPVLNQHGGIALKTAQKFPDPAVAADHFGKIRTELFKRSQTQQKTPGGKVKTTVYGFFVVEKNFMADPVGGGGIV